MRKRHLYIFSGIPIEYANKKNMTRIIHSVYFSPVITFHGKIYHFDPPSFQLTPG